ncbi:unnamed protein product, partial [Arabidopsis halleri]
MEFLIYKEQIRWRLIIRQRKKRKRERRNYTKASDEKFFIKFFTKAFTYEEKDDHQILQEKHEPFDGRERGSTSI